jgi:hypothetical protein
LEKLVVSSQNVTHIPLNPKSSAGTEENSTKLVQGYRSSSRDLNRRPPEHAARTQIAGLWSSLFRICEKCGGASSFGLSRRCAELVRFVDRNLQVPPMTWRANFHLHLGPNWAIFLVNYLSFSGNTN